MPLYSLALTLALLLTAPWWLFRMATTARYREGLRERLGKVPPALHSTIFAKRTIWLHAVSVGEVLAASTLIAQLEEALGPAYQVVISTTTRTGQRLARERFGPSRVFYVPLDFAFAVRAWLRVLQPELLILIESELWPRLLHESARKGVPVAVVNARVSDRSFRRSLRVRPLWRRMTQTVACWLAQSDGDADRLRLLGIATDRVFTTGNLKYDTRAPVETALTAAVRRFAAGRPVVLAGSTVHYGTTPEESLILEALKAHVWPDMPDVLLVLAPRHPQRFDEAAVLASQFGTTLRAADVLEWPQRRSAHLNRVHAPEDLQARVFVLDTIGDLAALYGIASVAFVGGSLLPHGGHNPLEPAQFGVPVIIGPHFQNFRDIVARLQAADGIVVLAGAAPDELGRAIAGLLTDASRATALGRRGRAVCEQQRGATARTLTALLPLLSVGTERKPDATGSDPRTRVPPESRTPEKEAALL